MKKYLIMLAVLVAWCAILPSVAFLTSIANPAAAIVDTPSGESSGVEKTQDVSLENSNIDSDDSSGLIDTSDESSLEQTVSDSENQVSEPDENSDVEENSEDNNESSSDTSSISDTTSETEIIKNDPPTKSAEAKIQYVKVYDVKADEIFTIELEEYILGVVYAEVPSSFNPETLKAQAIAARSFVVYNILTGFRERGHHGASLCTSPSHCTAYTTKAQVAERYGDEFAEESYKIMKKAVDDTKGMVMTYDGEPINAVFHASSSGFTEACADVWGGDIPYLVSVKTPDESEFYAFYGKVNYTPDEFKSRLASFGCDFSGNVKSWIKNIDRSSTGRCESITIGGVTITGEQFRSALRLKSSKFKISVSADVITIETEGYGHGVGMSQYGAEIMARSGSTYEEILKHYYTGVKIEPIDYDWFD